MAKIVIEVDTKTGKTNVKDLGDEFKKFDKKVDNSTKDIKRFSSEGSKALKKIAVAGAVAFSAVKIQQYGMQLIRIADTYTLIDAKIGLATKNQADFNKAYDELYRIGRDTGSTLEVNAQAFNKLALSMDFDLDELLRSQDVLNKSMVVAGTTASESAGFMLQYAQAMGSGVVNGDELRTMNEANSYIMAKIAKQFDTNIAGLKEMGAAGTLTSEKFFTALLKVGSEVDEQYGKIPITIQRALNDLEQVWLRIIGDSNKASEGTRSVADAISDLADTLDKNRPAIVKFFTAAIDGASDAVDISARFLNTFIAFRDYFHGAITPADYFSLDKESQRQYAEIRDELHQIAQIEQLLVQETGLFQRMLGNGLPEEQIREFEAHIEKLREKIAATLSGKDIKTEIPLKVDTSKVKTSLEQVNDAFHKSAERWMQKNGKTAEKVIKKYLEEIKKANNEIMSDTRDLASELSALSREGMTDKEAWNDVTKEISRYSTEAEKAAKAGDWEGQLDYLKRAKSLIGQLPSEGIKIEITDEAVKRSKQMAQYAADAARIHSTSATRQAAKKAADDYRKLLNEKKAGGRIEISQQDAINEKMNLTKSIGEKMIAVKQANLDKLKEEAKGFEETFKTYKEELETVKESTTEVVNETKIVGDTWVEVGGEWKRISADMVSDVNEINDAVIKLAGNMKDVNFKKSAAGVWEADGARANGGDVSAGNSVWVGERGLELFTPSHAGTVTPNNQLNQAAPKTVNIDFKINNKVVPLQGTQQSADMLIRELEEMKRVAS